MSQFYRTDPIIPGSAVPLLARLKDASGSYVTQATFSGITLDIYDTDDPDNPVVSALALSIPAVIYNTLQTDSRWTQDTIGYNAAYALLPAHTPRPDAEYRCKFTCTQVDGRLVIFVFTVPTKDASKAD